MKACDAIPASFTIFDYITKPVFKTSRQLSLRKLNEDQGPEATSFAADFP